MEDELYSKALGDLGYGDGTPKKKKPAETTVTVSKEKPVMVRNVPANLPPIKLNNGSMLTREMFENSGRNGLPFNDMQTMASWINEWQKNVPTDFPVSDYYRVHGSDNIPGGNIGLLYAMHKQNPQVVNILKRNIARPGEVPLYSAEDGDVIRKLLTQQLSQ